MKVAYIRVSSLDQNLDRQRMILEERGIEKWFEEKVSGKDMERPELKRMLEFVREGDTVYVVDFSRLARSVTGLLEIANELNRKKVKLVSVKESVDTTTPQGRLMMTVVGAIAEFERTIIKERQRDGIEAAKSRGVYAGRKPKQVPEFESYYARWKNREITLVKMAKELGVSRSTVYRLIHQHKGL